jgi:hypothetical protein
VAGPLGDPDRQAAALAEQARCIGQRQRELEQAERDLACDRETLNQEFVALQARILQTEQELGHRETEVEAAIRARWEQFQQHLRTAQEQLGKAPPAGQHSGLDDSLQRHELPHSERIRSPLHLKSKRGGSGVRRVSE